MKKFLAIVLTLLMLVSLAGCMKKVQKIPISDLKSRDGLMLVIGTEIDSSSDSEGEDRVVSIEHEIFWDGKITQTKHHSNSDDESWELDLSDDDYMKFYEFAESAYLNDSFRWVKQYNRGHIYTFDYYPADGKGSVCLFSGSFSGNEELSNTIDLAESYFADFEPETFEQLKYRTGIMANFYILNAWDKEAPKTLYQLAWSGSLSKYIFDDENPMISAEHKKASEDDYMAIYNWCKEAYMEDTFADYSKDECDDGILWRILYNDPDKEPFEIYYGCICENEELSAMADLITSYFE